MTERLPTRAEQLEEHRQFLADCFARLQAGGRTRESALGELFRREARNMAIHIRATWGITEPAEIDDLIQEVFIRLCRARLGKEEIAYPAGYLKKVVCNCVIDHWRREKPEFVASGIGSEDETVTEVLERLGGVSPDETEMMGLRDCIGRVLNELARRSPEGRLAIDLAMIEGYSGEELARVLGRTYGATREFLSQTKKKVADLLRQLCSDYVPADAGATS